MKHSILIIFLLNIFAGKVLSQNTEYKMKNYHPASPSAYEFLKYTEMPVSEYTGIPNISIPIFEIQEDGISIPLNLTYHAGGIRVNEEASWVGLGWNLQIGSIVQEINDLDDYGMAGDYYANVIRLLPDYNNCPVPCDFPWRWEDYPNLSNQPGNGWSNPYPIQNPQPYHSYMVSTQYYVPINGEFNNGGGTVENLGEKLLTWPEYDSEPDIFTANFLGHSISFIREPYTDDLIILNNKGYKAYRFGNGFRISDPLGNFYYFEISNTIKSASYTTEGLNWGGASDELPSSKIFMLTRIITNKHKQIQFNYSQSSLVENYPSYSEKWNKIITNQTAQYNLVTSSNQYNVLGYADLYVGTGNTASTIGIIAKTISTSKENRFYLTSISFPKGQINFNTSVRTDLIGGKKLDKIEIISSKFIKRYNLSYSYFSSNVGGNVFTPFNASTFGDMPNHRLKLVSIDDDNGAVHSFYYNENQLPPKNSLAQDYWGFYNGQLSNINLVPNPSRLNRPDLGDNGNNNSANLTYAQSGILNKIKYPSGGKVEFEYELNEFNNYWVPDFTSTANQISSGNGLRIKKVKLFSNDEIAKQTIYSYFDGIATVRVKFFRHFTLTNFHLTTPQYLDAQFYEIDEINGKGFFSTNSLGSNNSVGYGKVIKEDVNSTGVSNGKIETIFYNTEDRVNNSASGSTSLSVSLPTVKNTNIPENGLIKEIRIYNKDNFLVRKEIKEYITNSSLNYYGARIFGYGSMFFPDGCLQNACFWNSTPRTLIGYYPIYGIQSMLSSSTETNFDVNGNMNETTSFYEYNSNGQLKKEDKSIENGSHLINEYTYDIDYTRPAEVTNFKQKIVKQNNQVINTYSYNKTFSTWNNILLEHQVIINENPGPGQTQSKIEYTKYDQSNGNLLEFKAKEMYNSLIWDYNKEYLIAEVSNAKHAEIAATSFEANGSGNFIFTGTPYVDYSAPTGEMVYNLNNPISFNNLYADPAKEYIVTVWVKNNSGNCIVNGITGNVKLDKNGWKLYEYLINGNITTIEIAGTGVIDELRFFPRNSIITTYTYIPLIGITSQCDLNNKITYYEYDASNRLKLVRDFDKNIIKKICYNYDGQAEECNSTYNIEPWWTSTGETRCQPCPANNNYPSTVRERKEKDINPNSQSSNTFRWVAEGPGTCISPADWHINSVSCETDELSQNTGFQITMLTDMNPCSESFGQIIQRRKINALECPASIPVCNPETCVGPQYKCIRGVCETGVWSVIYVKKESGENWSCIYAYCFSDRTVSDYKVKVITTEPCEISCY